MHVTRHSGVTVKYLYAFVHSFGHDSVRECPVGGQSHNSHNDMITSRYLVNGKSEHNADRRSAINSLHDSNPCMILITRHLDNKALLIHSLLSSFIHSLYHHHQPLHSILSEDEASKRDNRSE